MSGQIKLGRVQRTHVGGWFGCISQGQTRGHYSVNAISSLSFQVPRWRLMLSHELSFKTGGLRAAWAPGLCVHEAGWALAEAWGVLSAGTARPGIPFVTPPEVQPGAPLPCLPSGGAHYAGCSLSPWAGLSPGPSVPSLRTERRAGCSRGQGLPMGTEGRTSPGESPAPATGEPDGVCCSPSEDGAGYELYNPGEEFTPSLCFTLFSAEHWRLN